MVAEEGADLVVDSSGRAKAAGGFVEPVRRFGVHAVAAQTKGSEDAETRRLVAEIIESWAGAADATGIAPRTIQVNGGVTALMPNV
jgi:hypothetical protein